MLIVVIGGVEERCIANFEGVEDGCIATVGGVEDGCVACGGWMCCNSWR